MGCLLGGRQIFAKMDTNGIAVIFIAALLYHHLLIRGDQPGRDKVTASAIRVGVALIRIS